MVIGWYLLCVQVALKETLCIYLFRAGVHMDLLLIVKMCKKSDDTYT